MLIYIFLFRKKHLDVKEVGYFYTTKNVKLPCTIVLTDVLTDKPV